MEVAEGLRLLGLPSNPPGDDVLQLHVELLLGRTFKSLRHPQVFRFRF